MPLYAGENNSFSGTGGERNYIVYSVSNKSRTALSGTTNVNSFECISENAVSSGIVLTETEAGDNVINFSDASLVMDISSFDCRNPLITRDMYRALGGSDSGIDIKLLDARLIGSSLTSSNGNFKANAEISINGQSNVVELEVDWQRPESMQYHFEGKTELSLSDFDIIPPSPAFGMIKVNDTITIHFNYIVEAGIFSRLD